MAQYGLWAWLVAYRAYRDRDYIVFIFISFHVAGQEVRSAHVDWIWTVHSGQARHG